MSAAFGVSVMYALYDIDGVLRFTCADREACMAYAKLFNLSSIECSLIPLSQTSEERKN